MTAQEYRKMTKEQLKGRKVRTNVSLKSRAMEIPAGTVLTVVGKSNGLDLESAPCNHCGVQVFIRKVEPYAVDLLPVGQAEKKRIHIDKYASDQMRKLWNQVESSSGELTPVMLAVKDAMMEIAAGNYMASYVICSRIAGDSVDFEYYGRDLVHKADGEWVITDSDLRTWSYIVLFGRRDYFPGQWERFGGQIHTAIKDVHEYQTLQRYKANGGLRPEHRKLLAKLNWNFDPFRFDGVCLYVGGKRPFGNSSIDLDMMDALGWSLPSEAGDIPCETQERLWQLFDELRFAIIDVTAESVVRMDNRMGTADPAPGDAPAEAEDDLAERRRLNGHLG